ncbi:hypothetical protein [Leptospira meyeri]|uniref:Cap15 family cyclic dinucleotide receptor domain-containing protein n=1 Tax=Leptospira meyeri TaxID=29508 RepID=UPI000F6514C5
MIPTLSIPIFTVFILAYLSLDKYLWKIKYFRKLFLVPDLNGIWEIKGLTVFRNGDKTNFEWNGQVIIKQSWSKITIILKTKTSKSESISASIISKPGSGYLLVYSYENKPEIGVEELNYHIGLTSMEINLECNSGSGEYFTNHSRQTSGKMEWLKKDDQK